MIIDSEDIPDARLDPDQLNNIDEVAQVHARGRWIWCVRRAGVEIVRGWSKQQLSDDELMALLHVFTGTHDH